MGTSSVEDPTSRTEIALLTGVTESLTSSRPIDADQLKQARNARSDSNPSPILIVAGESSGEMHAAELVSAIRDKTRDEVPHFFGCGGEKMRRSGVETLVDIHKLAVLGPFEAVSHVAHLYSALKLLSEQAKHRRPQLAILVDFPDFNLRLARRLKALGIPIVYFISPQVWAWRSRRVVEMKKTIDHMLVILPFEKTFYAELGMEVDFVGHPLVDRVTRTSSREDFFRKYQMNPDHSVISLMPGSRTKEIKYHLPVLLEVAQRLAWEQPVQFLLPLASDANQALVAGLIKEMTTNLPVRLVFDDNYDAVGHSDLAVVSSGTATLETAILGTPLIVVFRISNFTWIVGQYLVDVPFYSLVNLIAGKKIVPELYQQDFSPDRLHAEIRKYLDDAALRKRVKMELSLVKEKLGEGGAIERAAEKVWRWLYPPTSKAPAI
jgi:lipid-A-disaccharide synthase